MVSLTPEEKKKIYEEEKARLEAQEKLKKIAEEKEKRAQADRKAKENLMGCYGCLAIIVIVVLISLVGSVFNCQCINDPEGWARKKEIKEREKLWERIDKIAPSGSTDSGSAKSPDHHYKNASFSEAFAGEYWLIDGYDVPLVRERKAVLTKGNLIMTLDGGVKVQVVKTAGLMWTWKYVDVYDKSDEICARGWISSETVTRARQMLW